MSARAWSTIGVIAGLSSAAALSLARADSVAPAREPAAPIGREDAAPPAEEPVHAAPPPFTEGIFPCSQCHEEGGGDPTRRELAFHEDVKLKHAPTHWCADCHDMKNRDVLHLAGGEPVPFTESYRLCAQCHFDKHRDWRLGIHGKRVGQWNGKKTALLCVHCHNPHAPKFGSLKLGPRPSRPEEMRR